jgi:hypothetical protein
MISRNIAIQNFRDQCKGWFREKYHPLKGKQIILFGSAAKCEMMIKALDEIGMMGNIIAITCNDSKIWGGVKEIFLLFLRKRPLKKMLFLSYVPSL